MTLEEVKKERIELKNRVLEALRVFELHVDDKFLPHVEAGWKNTADGFRLYTNVKLKWRGSNEIIMD
jgi:hypothetical protein